VDRAAHRLQPPRELGRLLGRSRRRGTCVACARATRHVGRLYRGASPWYSAWYQLFPAAPVEIPVAVRPGDLVSARLSIRGSAVKLEFGNRSSRGSFATEMIAPAVESGSAEWIAEAPAMCLTRDCAWEHLATFTRVVFVDARAHAGTLRGSVGAGVWTTQPIQMRAISGRPRVVPTPLSKGGSSFAVQQLAAPTH
jgi:hypothetical protein